MPSSPEVPRQDSVVWIPADSGDYECIPLNYPNQPMTLLDGTKVDLNAEPIGGWGTDEESASK